MNDDELLAKIKSPGFNMAITRAATRWADGDTGYSRGDFITNASIEYLTGEPGTWRTAVDTNLGVGIIQ